MKKLFTLFMLCCTTIIALAQRPFITKWHINDINDLTLPLSNEAGGSFTYTYTKEGRPNITATATVNSTVITFPERGTYDIAITTTEPFKLSTMNYSEWRDNNIKLIEITQWGDINWYSDLSNMFNNAQNLYITATDIPNFSTVTNMSNMFSGCKTIRNVANMENWNVSNVIDMSGMFASAENFNHNINNWNVSNVTNMSAMFSNAKRFNQPLNNWNVSNVRNFESMFYMAENFNQNINNWNVSNADNMTSMFSYSYNFNQPLDNWDVSNVLNMSYMFFDARAFNQPLDNWDVSNVDSMQHMLAYAYAFNQDLGSWQFNRVVDLADFINYNGMDCTNYSKSIQGWSEKTINPRFRTISTSGKYYSPLVAPMRQQLIDNFFWEFEGDQVDPNCEFTLATNELIKNNTVVISPNPATSTFKLSSDKEVELVEIYNTAGQKLEGFKNTTTINVANYKPGMYIVKVTVKDGKVTSHKLIKK